MHQSWSLSYRSVAAVVLGGCLAFLAEANAEAPAAPDAGRRIVRQGLTVDFSVAPLAGTTAERRELTALELAEISFTITSGANGEPVRNLNPGAWIDLVETGKAGTTEALSCQDRVGLYMRGSTGFQPLIDVNSYFILVMNRDATISVVDPNVVIAGTSNVLFSQIILPSPGTDWAQIKDQSRVFVSMPKIDRLAVIETGNFSLVGQVETGPEPTRVAVQPDGRYVWVGNNGRGKEEGGVTVIDTRTSEVVANLATGKGHHEIAFTADDRFAMVSNRKDGTVTAIDIRGMTATSQVKVGGEPISLAYSPLSKAFYVADGVSGIISVIDGSSLEIVARIAARPGTGPMRVTDDGRWVLVTNAAADAVHVIDTSSNTLVRDIKIPGKPYQVALTRSFAYVRSLESERVSMINLTELGHGREPPVVTFPLGADAPIKSGELPIADSIVEAAGEAGVIAVDLAGSTIAYYMEGMNAPMGTFRPVGHRPRAAMIADRSLAEAAPGVYSAKIKVPNPGVYEAAFILDSPPMLHCFRFTALPNPMAGTEKKGPAVEYLMTERQVKAGETVRLSFRLTDSGEAPRAGLDDVRVLYYRAPGVDRAEVAAKDLGDGIYVAELSVARPGAYYVYVASAAVEAPTFDALPYLTLWAVADRAETARRVPPRKPGEGRHGQP